MGKGAQKVGLFSDESQKISDANAWQLPIERTVGGFLFRGINQRPAAFVARAGDLDVFVFAVLDALIDALVLFFQFYAQGGERFLDRRQQNRRANLAQHGVLVLPALGADQIILEAAEIVTVADVHVACLQRIA